MFYDQERAIALYHNAARKHETVRDPDLRDLQDAFPSLKPVFEEMQWLRNETARLNAMNRIAQQILKEAMENYGN